MRAILIDWLVEVHLKFKLVPETLYLTVNLIDRYLEKVPVMREKLQLVGVTAMLVASKFEEIYAPEVQDFVYITDKAYTKQEILECESGMLKALDFEVSHCSSWKFLQRLQKVGEADDFVLNMSRYLLELSLVEYRMLKHPPSMLAAASLYLSQKIVKRSDPWCKTLVLASTFKESHIRPCAKDLCILLQGVEKCLLKAVQKKFSLTKFLEVGKIRLNMNN